jgi:predicted RNA polymerase sigma factor
MEIQASRTAARVNSTGEPILILGQNRTLWNKVMIIRGLAALARAETLGAGAAGPYALQATIAACHARALTAEATDWKQIVTLYAELARRTPSPIVELNRAVAVAMVHGPAAALEILDPLSAEPTLRSYHLLPSVRADFLQKLGRLEEARAEFTRAATLTHNTRERDLLLGRAKACTNGSAPSSV